MMLLTDVDKANKLLNNLFLLQYWAKAFAVQSREKRLGQDHWDIRLWWAEGCTDRASEFELSVPADMVKRLVVTHYENAYEELTSLGVTIDESDLMSVEDMEKLLEIK
jgi:hypothetical protein